MACAQCTTARAVSRDESRAKLLSERAARAHAGPMRGHNLDHNFVCAGDLAEARVPLQSPGASPCMEAVGCSMASMVAVLRLGEELTACPCMFDRALVVRLDAMRHAAACQMARKWHTRSWHRDGLRAGRWTHLDHQVLS